MDHRDVVEHRQLLDRLLRLERAPQAPAGAPVVDHLEQVLAERADRARGGLDEAAEDVEERRLAGAVRADQAARAAREDDAHVVDRRHAGEADGEPFDLDHAAASARRRCGTAGASRAEVRDVLRHLLASPPGAVSSTCSRPTPKMISRKFGLMPHCAWKMNGTSWLKHAGDDGAPEGVDAADQRRREQRERVLRRER